MEKIKRARLQPFLSKGGARWVAEMSTNAIQTNLLFRKETLFMTSTKICEDTPPAYAKTLAKTLVQRMGC